MLTIALKLKGVPIDEKFYLYLAQKSQETSTKEVKFINPFATKLRFAIYNQTIEVFFIKNPEDNNEYYAAITKQVINFSSKNSNYYLGEGNFKTVKTSSNPNSYENPLVKSNLCNPTNIKAILKKVPQEEKMKIFIKR